MRANQPYAVVARMVDRARVSLEVDSFYHNEADAQRGAQRVTATTGIEVYVVKLIGTMSPVVADMPTKWERL